MLKRVLTLAVLTLLGNVGAVRAEEGFRFNADQSRVWYEQTPAGFGYRQNLYLEFTVGERQLLPGGSAPGTFSGVCGKYERTLEFAGQILEYYVWFSCVELDSFTIERLTSATANVSGLQLAPANAAAEYYGPVYLDITNLHWTGNNDKSPWVVQKGILRPSQGSPSGPGDHWMERYVTAAISGQVWNSSFPTMFQPSDSYLAEIGAIKYVATPTVP